MCITEYDEEWTKELFQEEAQEKGYLEASLPAVANIMKKLSYTPQQAMDLMGIPEEKRAGLLSALESEHV